MLRTLVLLDCALNARMPVAACARQVLLGVLQIVLIERQLRFCQFELVR
jgi:hypothetical protein